MIRIPQELLEQFERGNVLLFIGERITRVAEGQAVVDRLAVQMAARYDLAGEGELSFPETAQAYEDEHGRHALVQFVRDQLEALGDEPQRAHRLIAGLTDCNVLASTCLSQQMERAFEEAGRPLDVIVGNVDVAFEDEHKARLYKLHGSVERLESLVLTEDDYEAFFEDQTSISVVLQGYLARKTTLFVGYDLADPHFQRLYRKVTTPLDKYARRAYAFGEAPPARVSRWCERHGIQVVETDVTVFLEALTGQLAARARPTPAFVPRVVEELVVPLPERPYKFLDYYEAGDAAIFFGRRQEAQTLSSLIHAHRLVLLYGASGVGKTSLLLAGVVPRLEHADPPYEALYVRALEDPALAVRQAVRRRLPGAHLLKDGPLVDFLDAATQALGRTLVITLDQFEEFFIRLSPQYRTAFVGELGALYDTRDVPVKVVLSLREDWLASVGEIETRIPDVFRTRMHLLPLARDQARQAITAPVERLEVRYEQALVEQLLDDLAGHERLGVMPPQLQLVCSALYDGLAPGERRITLAAYERLGGTRGVLRRYLDDELARLGSAERVLAGAVLEELVTSQGTKAVKTGDELARALRADLPDMKLVLDKLVRARLLRTLEHEDGRAAYELAHEYLIREISVGAEAQKRKQAEELIQQEVENWRRFGTLLGADKLALIGEVRETLRLDTDAQELLLRSTLQIGHDAEYWLGRVEDESQRTKIVHDCLHDYQVAVRVTTAQALRAWDTPVASRMLIDALLQDKTALVRQRAAESLRAMKGQEDAILARLLAVAQGHDREQRCQAMDGLAWYLHVTGRPYPLPRRLKWPIQLRLARIRVDTARPQIDLQMRTGGVAALVGATPLAVRLAIDTMDGLGTASSVVVFVVVLVLYSLLCGLGGLVFGRGLAIVYAVTRGWHLAAKIGGMGLASALLGLLALYPLFLERQCWFVGWIVGLAFGLLLTAVDAAGLRPNRRVAIALGVLLGGGTVTAGLLLTHALTFSNTLPAIAVGVLTASLAGASVTRSKPDESLAIRDAAQDK